MEIDIINIEFWEKHGANDGGVEITWSCKKGFGTFQYYLKDGKFYIADDEYMGIDFAQAVLNKALTLSV